jgi:endoglucanase
MKNIFKVIIPALILFVCAVIIACGDDNSNNEKNNNGDDPFDISAMDFVSNMRVGWNLGNTFDAVGGGSTVAQLESAWVGTVTTKENIDAIKNAGFDIIRIPVSWSKVADPDNNFTIRADWMFRIIQVVDWALDNEMYIILNTHHDSGAQGTIFRFLDSNVERSLEIFERIWEQIAEAFKWHDVKLIFSPLNEPRTTGVPTQWTGRPEEYNNINRHYQLFVDTVRASGGFNDRRFLLFTTYAASGSEQAMEGLVLPQDTAKDKIIVSYHAYVPGNFAFGGPEGTIRYNTTDWSEEGRGSLDITDPMNRFYEKFVKNGIPVIIGEFGATNKNNEEARARWVEFYTRQAWERGMRVIWWDNATIVPRDGANNNNELFGLLDRRTNQIIFPKIMEGLLRGSE